MFYNHREIRNLQSAFHNERESPYIWPSLVLLVKFHYLFVCLPQQSTIAIKNAFIDIKIATLMSSIAVTFFCAQMHYFFASTCLLYTSYAKLVWSGSNSVLDLLLFNHTDGHRTAAIVLGVLLGLVLIIASILLIALIYFVRKYRTGKSSLIVELYTL